jgi:hypothetical protein
MTPARRLHIYGPVQPLSKPRFVTLRYILSALVFGFAVTVFCTVGPGAV